MSRQTLLRLHRWITLVFSLPLAILLVTGLILSVEPIIATTSIAPGAVTAQSLDALLARHDPTGQARGLVLRAYDGPAGSLTLSGVRDGPLVIDLATGAEKADIGALAQTFLTSRRLHEHLLFDLGWLVTASTIALVVLIVLGVLMGWPRLAWSVAGWHKGVAWFSLPLVIVSPLTGLFIAWGIGFTPGPPPRESPPPLRDAVRIVAATHDPARLIWLRNRGRGLLARIDVVGEYRVYIVGRAGLTPVARNWPRLIHEGNWAGVWSGLVDVVTSFALLGLFGTGLFIWGRRQTRRRRPRSPAPSPALSGVRQ